MALNLYEKKDSGGFTLDADSLTLPRKWIAFYSDDRAAVYAAISAVAPLVDAGYRRQNIDAQPLGAGFWDITVNYGTSATGATDADDTPEEPGTPGDDNSFVGPETSFDCSAQQVHITQSLKTNYRWTATEAQKRGTAITVDAVNNLKVTPTFSGGGSVGALDVGKVVLIPADEANGFVGGAYTITAQGGGQWTLATSPAAVTKATGRWTLIDPTTAGVGSGPNYKQAIGVTTDNVAGTDIYAPHFEFTYSYQTRISKGYIKTIRKMGGRTNSIAWWGFAAGEVLYLGASAQCGPDGIFKITHKFAVGENLVAVPVSDDIIVPSKGAWEYLWCVYTPGLNAGAVVQTPAAAFVEQVYRSGAFAANLGF